MSGMTPRDALDRIAALCDERNPVSGRPVLGIDADAVRAILADVSPQPGATLTPKEAALALSWYYGQAGDIIVGPDDRALAARLEELS